MMRVTVFAPIVPSPCAKAWCTPPPHASILYGRTTSALAHTILLNTITCLARCR
eukprot:m.187264 g.187264  ORF g.187264 m.187264 type:complete len:54 (+) comp10012_c2_seq53:149-310(+)